MGRECGTQGRREVHIGFWLVDVKALGCMEDLGMDQITVLKWMLKKQNNKVWNRLIWFRIKTSCRPF